MAIEIPSIHDLGFEDLLAEAKARIPVHTPEWTNFNDSDPGVTLLHLFAFMTDNLLYRANRIPERNRAKFLQLLDIPIEPASAATGMVTFQNARGPIRPTLVGEGTEVLAGRISYRSTTTAEVLPIEGAVYYKAGLDGELDEEERSRYLALYTDLGPSDAEPVLYETRKLEPPAAGPVFPRVELATDTIDGSLWLALLARDPDSVAATREAIGGRQLTIGVMPGVDDATRALYPASTRRAADDPGFEFWVPVGGRLPDPPASREPTYARLDAVEDTDIVTEPGLVDIDMPPASELALWDNVEPSADGVGSLPPLLDDTERERLVTWIRIRRRTGDEAAGNEQASLLSASVSWVGVNAARIVQRADVVDERLGVGDGRSGQTFTLANTPVLADSVTVTVGDVSWTATDDLLTAGSELTGLNRAGHEQPSQVFAVDRHTGTLTFGDGINGARPEPGREVRASYAHGGGAPGTVPAGAISKGPSLPAGVAVVNPVPTWGGAEAESVPDAERRMAQVVRHRNRLVSVQDFVDVTEDTPGVDLARVDVLPLLHPDIPGVESPGVVTILVVPRFDPVQPAAPRPDRMFLDAVCNHLDARRLVTTELHVRGPAYVPIVVSIGIEVESGRALPPIRDAVQLAVRRFLSPVPLDDEPGWPLGKTVDRLEIWTAAAKVDGVAKVVDVVLGGEASPDPVDRVELADLELPHLTGLSVQPGDPAPMSDLVGRTFTSDRVVLPIPNLVEEC